LQGHWRVIQSKHDLDDILQMTMCSCIFYNLLIDHAMPQDWMADSSNLELDEEEEFITVKWVINVIKN